VSTDLKSASTMACALGVACVWNPRTDIPTGAYILKNRTHTVNRPTPTVNKKTPSPRSRLGEGVYLM